MIFRLCLQITIISETIRAVMIAIGVTTEIEGVVEEVGIIKGMITNTPDLALGIIEIVEGERSLSDFFWIQ